MRYIKSLLVGLAVALIAACGGGGGDSGASSFGVGAGGGTGGSTASAPVAADLVLVLSASSISNSGTETVVATATALDSKRNSMAGVPVSISVDNGGVATVSSSKTGENGAVSAAVGIGADRSNRTINVVATSGSVSRSVTLQVTDTGGAVATASDLVLQLSSSTIVNSGAETVTATVTALDARRNVLPGVGVLVSVNSGATAAVSGPVTNDQGLVTARIGTGGDTRLRTITVTATSGGVTRTALLEVANVPATQGPVAADLSLTLSSRVLDNGGTNTIEAVATAVDSNRNALAGIPVKIQVDASAVAVVGADKTDARGRVTAQVGIGQDRTNRTVTVSATSGTITRTASFVVQGAKITASFAPQVNTGSQNNEISYALVDANSLPMAGEAYTVSAPDGTSKTGRTDVNGRFSFSYVAPLTAVTFTVVARAAGAERLSAVAISASSISPVPANLEVTSGSLTPTPSVMSVNATSSGQNQSELRALFAGRDSTTGQSNVPVPNVRVRFDILNNQDGSLGSVSWVGGDYAIADSVGLARGTFRPGPRSSPTNGVSVRACWERSDFDISTCPNPTIATLTVVDEALSVNIRTNELIKEGAARLTYIKEYVVMVVDAAGQARADVLITPSVDLTGYYKGDYAWSESAKQWVQTISAPMCPNEDVNRNGIREANAYSSTAPRPPLAERGEDTNWNGELDPRKADVAVKMVGSAKTDASGLAIVQIEYGKDLASWVDFVVTVTASGISGTESRATYVGARAGLGNLPFPAEAVADEKKPPAFVVSPYGRSASCEDKD